MHCSGFYNFCVICIILMLMQFSGCWCIICMQCFGFEALLRCFWIFQCLCNVQELMQCLGVDAMFECLCNVWIFMQFSGFDAFFGCWYNVRMFNQRSGMYAMLECWCIVPMCHDLVLMQCWCNVHLLMQF